VNRIWLLLGMGLAGILTVALIVSADQTYAGIDGLRAVTAYPPASEQDPPPSIPVLTGLLDGIRDLPIFSPPAPADPDGSAAGGGAGTAPAASSPGPSTLPSSPAQPGASAPPAGPSQPPAAVTPAPRDPSEAPSSPAPSAGPAPSNTPAPSQNPAPTATPAPSTTPGPSATPTPAPSSTPTATPSPTPTATPTPTLTLTTNRGAVAVVNLADLVPGDTMNRTITLKNTGTVGFRYAVSATHTASTLLWTDTTQGLQLTVGAFDGTVLYSGPISGLGSLASGTTLAPGDTELLSYTFDYPSTAPDSFQGLVQDLTLVFTATQYP
jgi:outer membrane biosynthesis protein TonB